MNIVNPLDGFRISRRDSPLETSMAVVDAFSDRKLSIGDLLDATLAVEPNRPARVKRNFTVGCPN
jgi:hypothetical protein